MIRAQLLRRRKVWANRTAYLAASPVPSISALSTRIDDCQLAAIFSVTTNSERQLLPGDTSARHARILRHLALHILQIGRSGNDDVRSTFPQKPASTTVAALKQKGSACQAEFQCHDLRDAHSGASRPPRRRPILQPSRRIKSDVLSRWTLCHVHKRPSLWNRPTLFRTYFWFHVSFQVCGLPPKSREAFTSCRFNVPYLWNRSAFSLLSLLARWRSR